MADLYIANSDAWKVYRKYETFKDIDIRDYDAVLAAGDSATDSDTFYIFRMFVWMARGTDVPFYYWIHPRKINNGLRKFTDKKSWMERFKNVLKSIEKKLG